VFYVLFGIFLESLCLWVIVVSGPFLREEAHAQSVAAEAQIAVLNLAVHLYKNDVGSFPSPAQGLKALRENPGVAGWKGPYLRQDVPLDPWGRPFIYRVEGIPEMAETVPPSWEERFGQSALFWSAITCGVGYPFLPWMLRRFKVYRSAR
jgi:type II secretion system protein G